MKNGLTINDYREIIREMVQETLKALRVKGKKYMYVEATHKYINNGKEFIGLFRGGYPTGKGYGMGWYGAEYLRFTRCLAVNKEHYNKFLPQISISTMLRIENFHANNDKEARKKFTQIIAERNMKNKSN